MLFWKETIKFKNLEVPRFMAAPLDGVTDSPMRILIREYSPDILLFTEMKHVGCIANSKNNIFLRLYNKTMLDYRFYFWWWIVISNILFVEIHTVYTSNLFFV